MYGKSQLGEAVARIVEVGTALGAGTTAPRAGIARVGEPAG